MKYKISTGGWKSLKNVLIVWAIPAVLLLADNYTEWVPNKYHVPAAGILGFVSYFIKNWIENK